MDIGEQFCAACTLFRRGDEYGGQFFPLLGEDGLVVPDIGLQFGRAEFVGFGKDNGKGDAVLTQPFDELKVNALRFVSAVEQEEQAGHLHAVQDVVFNNLSDLLLLFFPALGISVSWKIDQIPFLIDEEMIDEQSLTGCRTGHGQFVVACKHVDETAFAHIASSDECVFWFVILRTFLYPGVADDKAC